MAAAIHPNRENKSQVRQELIIRHIINDIMAGGIYSVIIQKLTEDGYNLGKKYSNSTARNLYTAARKRIKADFDDTLPQIKENLTTMLLDLFTEAKEVGDRQASIKCLQEIAKLTGAYAPIQTESKVETYVIDFNLDNNEENKD